MNNIKYQIFISSTYADLADERQVISRAILDMGHIPAGMEMFPASDTDQLVYIKKIIDECDYYILVLGARYGSTDPDGVSFTEREYEYAVESDKTVLAFVHSNMDSVAWGKTDKDQEKTEKLQRFKDKVRAGRLVKFWSNPNELGAQAILSLTKAFANNPQIGWVRADKIPEAASLENIVALTTENERLRKEMASYKLEASPNFPQAAGLDTLFSLNYSSGGYSGDEYQETFNISYENLLRMVAPAVASQAGFDKIVDDTIAGLQDRFHARAGIFNSLNKSQLRDALLHLVALGMLELPEINGKVYYKLSSLGKKTWLEMSYRKLPS